MFEYNLHNTRCMSHATESLHIWTTQKLLHGPRIHNVPSWSNNFLKNLTKILTSLDSFFFLKQFIFFKKQLSLRLKSELHLVSTLNYHTRGTISETHILSLTDVKDLILILACSFLTM